MLAQTLNKQSQFLCVLPLLSSLLKPHPSFLFFLFRISLKRLFSPNALPFFHDLILFLLMSFLRPLSRQYTNYKSLQAFLENLTLTT